MNRHASSNRIYRLVWNSARAAFVPAPETTRGKTKGARSVSVKAVSLIAAACFAPEVFAQSLPQGGVIRAGGGSITSSGSQMQVTTSTSRTAIDWNSFSIGSGDQVTIDQPTSTSITLNRVVGGNPSRIFGELTSNGEVVLANPNGIWFGPNAYVNVASLLATTNHLGNAAVSAFSGGGGLTFDPNTGSSSIVNQGTITVADGGLAGLVAPGVRNSGTITAKGGTIVLASGAVETVDFYGDGLINLAVSGQTVVPSTGVDGSLLNAAVDNSGTVIADGGTVRLSANVAAGVLNNVIDMSGVIEARGVSTAGGTVELLGGNGSVSVKGTIDVSGQGNHAGGTINIQAGEPTATQDGIADIGGSLDASSAAGSGGQITVTGRIVTPSGTISADGASGGSVEINSATLVQSGGISADGSTGPGGQVTLAGSGSIIQTSYATTTADSTNGAGGTVTLSGGSDGRVFSSGLISAQGSTGGDVSLLGTSIGLADATIQASGQIQGGQILVGGGLHGQGEPAATTTQINPSTTLTASAEDTGDGGTIVVWSSSKTIFQGTATARGGSDGGNGGLIEVSSGDDLAFTGIADAGATHGTTGTLLLDPQNIVIDTDAGNVAQYNLIDPDAGLGTGFGTFVVQLSNGTVLVTKPGDTVGGAANAGSIFYFNPTTGALLAAFQGSHAGDQVGSMGVTFLNYQDWYNNVYLEEPLVNDTTKAYLISSPDWDNGAGAVTWVAANSTVSGVLSSSNSLVGSTAGDALGTYNGYNNLYVLPNGNYLVSSPNWNNGRGELTFGTAAAGIAGVVSSTNSLVGSTPNQSETYNTLSGDAVGSGYITYLTNGNFVVLSPNWNAEAGAVTFGTETGGTAVGTLSSSNSLVGATGAEAYVTTNTLNGNSHSNDYYGGDQVGGENSVYPLANGGYAVVSPNWYHDRGAVTIGSGTTGISGVVSTSNSLTGTTPGVGTGGQGTGTYNGSTYYTDDYGVRYDYGGDELGSGGVTQLTNGNLVISSPAWNQAEGAVTFLPSTTTALGTSGSLATVTSSNSLVGTHQSTNVFGGTEDADFAGGDSIGSVTALSNGNYVVSSTLWNSSIGAVTLMNGSNGHAAVGSSGSTGDTVSATNSLVGSTSGDEVGTVTALLNNSNFVVSSTNWSDGKGEVTLVNGTTGLVGAVSSSNSLVGTTSYQSGTALGADEVGSSIVPLSNGNWIIVSPDWSMTKGAVTFVSASATPTGNISASNSLVGSTAGTIYCTTCADGGAAIFGGDSVGSGGITVLPNNDFLIGSPSWDANRGAATFVNGATGAMVNGTSSLTGTISSSNSLVGSNAGTVKTSAENYSGINYVGFRYYVGGDQIGTYQTLYTLSNGNFVVDSSTWNTQAGAVTFGTSSGTLAGGGAFAGVVSSSNSLVGSTAGVATAPSDPTSANWSVVGGDQVGSAGLQTLPNSAYLVFSPEWSNTAGAVTWGSGTTGVVGAVSATNSLVGSVSGDMVGATTSAYIDVTVFTNGNYVIESPSWNSSRGAATFGTSGAAVTGVVSATNSLVGTTAGDGVGNGGTTPLPNGDYVINSPSWNGGIGAATWSQGAGATTGTISSTNSILGVDSANDSLTSYAGSDPKSFFVALPFDNSGSGSVILAGTDPTIWNFAAAQGNTVTIAPSLIESSLNAGTNVVLDANNDITVSSAVKANAAATGALTLDAGRSVLINANINTGDGALTITGNDTVADGVINSERSSGTAVITVANGVTLSSGTAALSIDLAASTDKTYNTAGNVTVAALDGASVSVTNLGSASGDLTLDGVITATGSGTSILLTTGGELINTAGATSLSPGAGRYLVYSADPRTNTLDGLTDPTHYFGATYTLNGPGTQASSGNIFLYSVVPTLTVTSNGSTGYGTPASGLTAQITGFIDGDTAATAVSGSASLTTGYVAGDAVGGSYPITVGLGTLTSSLGYGFTLVNGNVTVTQQPLTLSLIGSVTKPYDGTTTAVLAGSNYQISGLYGSDSISVTQPSGTYASANAGSGIDITAALVSGDFSAGSGTSLGNYVVPTGNVTGAIGSITPLTLTASLTGSATKVYNGTTTAALTGPNYHLSGLIGSQSISVNQTVGTYASSDVGTSLGVTADLASGNYTAGSGTLLSNYTLPTSASGNIGSITAAPFTVSLTGSASKTYDGTTTAALTGSNYQIGGLVSGQTIDITQTAGTYAAANVGNPISVSTSLASGDFTAGSGTSLSNYTLPTGMVSGAIGAITPAALAVSLTGTTSKVYDGTTTATLSGSNYQVTGLVSSQSVSVTLGAGSYASPDVGSSLTVTSALTSGDFTAGSGTQLSNYTLPTSASGSIGTITPAPLTSSLIGTTSKSYDGTTTATLSGSNYQLTGLVGSQSIDISQTSGTYASANAGSSLNVTASLSGSNFAAGSGTLLSNYSLPSSAQGTIGTITPAQLTVTLINGSVSRPYDGNTSASIASSDYQLSGLAPGQTITIAPTTGTYSSADAGSSLGVTGSLSGSNFTAGTGTLLSNYVLPVGTFNITAGTITPAPLTVSLTGSTSKVYDGTAAATLSGSNYQITGLVTGESINITQPSGTYQSPNAGSAINVNSALASSDYSAGSETLLSNYTLPTGTLSGAIGTITPAPLTVSVTGSTSKVYDGTAAATLSGSNYQITGLVTGESINITQPSGTYQSPNAGSAINVNSALASSDYSAGSETLLSNYTLPTGTLSGAIGTITPAPLTVSLTGSTSKVYDGTAAATLSGSNYQITGLVTGESINITQPSGTYQSPNAGSSINVNSALTSSDYSAGSETLLSNYTLPTGTLSGAIGTITPAPLTVTAGSATRPAETANPTFPVTYSSFVGQDTSASLTTQPTVSTAATQSSSAGTYPTVPSGATDPNYTIAYVDGVLTVTPGQTSTSPSTAGNSIQDNTSNTIQNYLSGNISLLTSPQNVSPFQLGESASFEPSVTSGSLLAANNDGTNTNAQAQGAGGAESANSAQGTNGAANPGGAANPSPQPPGTLSANATSTAATATTTNNLTGANNPGTGTSTGTGGPSDSQNDDKLGRGKLGVRDPDRDVHSYANAYLSSIGLGSRP